MPEHLVQWGMLVGVDSSTGSRCGAVGRARSGDAKCAVDGGACGNPTGRWLVGMGVGSDASAQEFVERHKAEAYGWWLGCCPGRRTQHRRPPTPANHPRRGSQVVPTLVDLTKEAQMIVWGAKDRVRSAAPCRARSATRWYITRTVRWLSSMGNTGPAQLNAPVLVGVDGSTASELATAIALRKPRSAGSTWWSCIAGATMSCPISRPSVIADVGRPHTTHWSSGWQGGRSAIPRSPCNLSSSRTNLPSGRAVQVRSVGGGG